MSGKAILLGVDLGTTVCRAVAFDENLRALGSATRQLSLITRPGAEIEQDAEAWWSSTCEVVRESLRTAGRDPRDVKGLSVASQGISFVPVDGQGTPLRMAFSWLDTRAVAQRRLLIETFGERGIFSLTGKRCHETYLLPKLLWLRQSAPDVYARTARILMPLDFLVARMTGEYVTDHTMASGTMLYDITRQEWSRQILARLDIEETRLPRILRAGTPVGGLRPEAADLLGLPRDVVVSVGGQDQKVAALGAGLDAGRCTISLGTAMAVTRKSGVPIIDADMRVPCFSDLLKGSWLLEGSSNCCSIFDWARQTLFAGMSLDELNRIADEAADRPDPVVLLPSFAGAPTPFFSPRARGTLHGLGLSTTPGQIVRAIYEGVAFVIRANVEVMEAVLPPAGELRIFGGGSRSDVWCRIIADVMNRPVTALATSEVASVGAAMLAGLGCGVFRDVDDVVGLVETRASYSPSTEHTATCDARYARFIDLNRMLLREEEK